MTKVLAEVVALLRLYHEDRITEDELLKRLEPYLVSETGYLMTSPRRGPEPR